MLVSLEATLRPAEERLGRTQRQPQCQPAEHSGEQSRLLPLPAWMPELQPKPYRAGVKAVFQPHPGVVVLLKGYMVVQLESIIAPHFFSLLPAGGLGREISFLSQDFPSGNSIISAQGNRFPT